jgi:hypothetical protein
MAAVAIALAIVQASAMALANAACCCRMPMASSTAPCPMQGSAAAMPAHHQMDGMAMDDAPAAPADCHLKCSSSMSIFVTPGVTPHAPVVLAIAFVSAPTPPTAVQVSIDLTRTPYAPPPRA